MIVAAKLAGTNHFASIAVDKGGTIRGVGLLPLVLAADGDVLVNGTIDVSGLPGTVPQGSGNVSSRHSGAKT